VTFYVVNSGEQAIIEDGITGVAYELQLYKTDVTAGLTPDEIDALETADFTMASFTGYALEAVGTGDWTITQGNPTVARNVEKSFTSTANQSAQNIWGYTLTRTSDDLLIGFEQFSAPIVVEFNGDQINITPTLTLDDSEGNVIPTGMISAFGGAIGEVPDGWRICYGQAISRTTFADLFNVIGTTYGVGDGSTTFNLPNLRQKFPLGHASSGTGSTLGGTGGAIDHVHDLETSTAIARISGAAGSTDNAWMDRSAALGDTWAANNEFNLGSFGTDSTVVNSGALLQGDTDTENPPFLAVNFIIKT
jgi:microcystin-dependent protein